MATELSSVSAQRLAWVVVTADRTTYRTKEKPIEHRQYFGLTIWNDGRCSYSLYRRNKGWYDCCPVEFIGIMPAHYPWIANLPGSAELLSKLRVTIHPNFTNYGWNDPERSDCCLECRIKIEDGVATQSWAYRNGAKLDINNLGRYDAELYAIPHQLLVHRWIWG